MMAHPLFEGIKKSYYMKSLFAKKKVFKKASSWPKKIWPSHFQNANEVLASTHTVMHASTCMAEWMDVYVNEATEPHMSRF